MRERCSAPEASATAPSRSRLCLGTGLQGARQILQNVGGDERLLTDVPGADFRGYTKVIIDEPEAAFRKNWLRDYNRSSRGVSRRLSDDDAQKMLGEASKGLKDVFTKAFTDGGYQVVTQPGPDVLRIRTAVIDLHVNAPDMNMRTAGRSRSYSSEAGTGTLILEARDSETPSSSLICLRVRASK